MSTRSPVYVVFVSSKAVDSTYLSYLRNDTIRKQATNLFGCQYNSYAFYSPRRVGDQPGNPRGSYLSAWKTLPEGVFVALSKFNTAYDPKDYATNRGFARYISGDAYNSGRPTFPFPSIDSPQQLDLPYVCFNGQGQLVSENVNASYDDAYIPLARGSIFYARDQYGKFIAQSASVVETPANNSLTNYNRIHISWATGRAKLERLEISK
jgi:hypothetical protein